MAGSYPNTPSERIAYHIDGTVMWMANSQLSGPLGGGGYMEAMLLPPEELSSTEMAEYNDEDSVPLFGAGGVASVDYGFAWIWPEKRDIFGFYGYVQANGAGHIVELHTSTDSRNGITGSFTTQAAHDGEGQTGTFEELIQPTGNDNWSVQHSYREFIHPLDSTGTTAVRVRTAPNKTLSGDLDNAQYAAFHWYGTIADSANPDRILFMDNNTGLEMANLQDWGDIPRGSVHDKEIFLLNNSATLSATSNVLTFQGGYEDSYTWYTIQDDAAVAPAFSTTLTIDGPIGPGDRYPTASSEVLTVRLTVDPDENLGPAAARLQLETGDWST